MKTNEEKQLVTQALNALASAIERGESEQLKAYLATRARFHRYSVGNVLLIGMQRPGATRVAGVRAWNKLGRHVRQGEKGIRIFAPIVWRKMDDKQEGKEGNETEELVRFRSVCVFDVAQTEGRPLPEFAQARGEPGEYTGRLMVFATEQGIQVEFSDALVSAHGLSSGGNIVVRKGMSPAEEFSVLAHELAHELLHRDAEDYGRTISFFVHLYHATGEPRYLRLAEAVAREAVSKLYVSCLRSTGSGSSATEAADVTDEQDGCCSGQAQGRS